MNGNPLPVVEEVQFLGVIFDKKLSFVPNLRYLETKRTKAVNVLRVVVHTPCGADQQTLLHLYRSLILDYGCIVYGCARGSYLQMLDPIENHALVFVWVLINLPHPLAYVYLQMNHLSMYEAKKQKAIDPVFVKTIIVPSKSRIQHSL